MLMGIPLTILSRFRASPLAQQVSCIPTTGIVTLMLLRAIAASSTAHTMGFEPTIFGLTNRRLYRYGPECMCSPSILTSRELSASVCQVLPTWYLIGVASGNQTHVLLVHNQRQLSFCHSHNWGDRLCFASAFNIVENSPCTYLSSE